MPVLHHYALSAASRIVRLHLAEYEREHELKTQLPWQRDEAFLALNPAGDLPVLVWPDGRQLAGARVICEWLEETAAERAAIGRGCRPACRDRRLFDWFEIKFTAETSAPLLRERVVKRFSSAAPVSSQTIRAALANSQIHLGLYKLAAGDAQLAGRGGDEPGRSGRRRASVGAGLFRRYQLG